MKVYKINNVKYVQTLEFTINIEEAVKDNEISNSHKHITLSQNDIIQYENVINELKLINNNIFIGLCTKIEKNAQIMNLISNFYFGYLRRNNDKVRKAIESTRLNFKTLAEEYKYSWNDAIEESKSYINEIGFLHYPSEISNEIVRTTLNFLEMSRKNGIDKHLRIDRVLTGTYISRARNIGQWYNCKKIY